MYAEFDEDPLLRHNRVETASTLGNAIIDVINEHVMAHGVHDPALTNIRIRGGSAVLRSEPELGAPRREATADTAGGARR